MRAASVNLGLARGGHRVAALLGIARGR
jgi:hypothetical protein